jgi:hypothetical protein
MQINHKVVGPDGESWGDANYELSENSPVGIILRSSLKVVQYNQSGSVETYTNIGPTPRSLPHDCPI